MAVPAFQHFDFQDANGVAVLTLRPRQIQTDQTVEELRRELHQAAETSAVKKWVLDFTQVEHFNTAALRPLLSLHRKIQPEGGRIVLCALREALAEVLRVTRLVDGPSAPFALAKDLAEGLALLRHHTAQIRDGVLIFTFTAKELHGDDLANDLGVEMQGALQEHGTNRIVCDFSQVVAITTPCMRPLLQLRTSLKNSGGRVVFANLAPQVAEIFTVTRLVATTADQPGLFDAYASNAAAVQALKQA